MGYNYSWYRIISILSYGFQVPSRALTDDTIVIITQTRISALVIAILAEPVFSNDKGIDVVRSVVDGVVDKDDGCLDIQSADEEQIFVIVRNLIRLNPSLPQ